MRKQSLFREAHWPDRKDRRMKTHYQSSIPIRDWKYWLVVFLALCLLVIMLFVLLKAV